MCIETFDLEFTLKKPRQESSKKSDKFEKKINIFLIVNISRGDRRRCIFCFRFNFEIFALKNPTIF